MLRISENARRMLRLLNQHVASSQNVKTFRNSLHLALGAAIWLILLNVYCMQSHIQNYKSPRILWQFNMVAIFHKVAKLMAISNNNYSLTFLTCLCSKNKFLHISPTSFLGLYMNLTQSNDWNKIRIKEMTEYLAYI